MSHQFRRPLHIESLEQRLPLTTQLLLDYNTSEAPFEGSHFVEWNGDAYFVANASSAQHIEIWKTDGSGLGTSPVAVVEHGYGRPARVNSMMRLKDQLVLLASKGDPPELSLYVSDGTAAGTREVMASHFGGVSIGSLQAIGDTAYFTADPWHGDNLLMATDGTKDGTRILASYKGPLDNFAVTGGGVFFAAGGSTTRFENGEFVQFATELWFYDNATAKARAVRQIDRGSGHDYADPLHLTAVGEHVYFTAETSVGRELWFSDATLEGTQLVRDLLPGASASNPSMLTAIGNKLYFLARDERGTTLWAAERLDDTFNVNSVGMPFTLADGQLVVGGDSLYVVATSGQGYDVFEYSTITETVAELGQVSGTDAHWQSSPLGPALVSQVDGQRQLTLVHDNVLVQFPGIGFEGFLGDSNTSAYFATQDSDEIEIWYTEGTKETTKRIDTIESRGGAATIGEDLVLSARKNGQTGLWKVDSDGLSLITAPLSRNGSSTYHSLNVVNGKAIVAVESGFNDLPYYVAWQTDTFVVNGVEAEKLVTERFVWGNHGGWPDRPYLHAVGSDYYFAAQTLAPNGGYTEQIWKTDLTPEGTERSSFQELSERDPTVAKDDLFGFYPWRLEPLGLGPYVDVDDRLRNVVTTAHGRYFLTSRFENGGRVDLLYRIVDEDSPPELIAETGLLPSFSRLYRTDVAGYGQRGGTLFEHDDILYFLSSDESHGVEVWRSDGTAGGTRILADLNPGVSNSLPSYLGAVDGKLLFLATNDAHGQEIWSVTTTGDVRIHEIRVGVESSGVQPLGIVNNTIVVVANDGIHGREIWTIRSDGTLEQFDIHLGETGSDPFVVPFDFLATARLGEKIYFSADDGIHGRELWVADSESVRLERDIRQGPIGSHPVIRAQLADALLFVANDGIHGRELWSIVPDEEVVVGDADGDGEVSFTDFVILSANYGRTTSKGADDGDFDGNGVVNYLDFVELSKAWEDTG